jgi:hypothetical protein
MTDEDEDTDNHTEERTMPKFAKAAIQDLEALQTETSATDQEMESLEWLIGRAADSIRDPNGEGVVPFAPLGDRGPGIKFTKSKDWITRLYIA